VLSRARTIAVAALAVAVAGELLYLPFARDAPRIVAVELAGSAAEIRDIAADRTDSYVSALRGDFLLIPAYVLAVMLAVAAFAMVSRRRGWAAAAAGCAVLAGLCDGVENLALLGVLSGAGGDAAARAAQVLAAVKFALLGYAVPAALVCIGFALRRGSRPAAASA
jgi:hypothetical protein